MKAALRLATPPREVAPDRRPLLLIPAYKPAPGLAELVKAMLGTGQFAGAIVVDDGSGPTCATIFERCRRLSGVTVLSHAINRGKGAALKTGLAHAARQPDVVGVVTADADGQHAPEDVGSVAATLRSRPSRLVLGARSFGEDVPLRSRVGNLVTRRVMRFATGQRLADTQTGLRGIPRTMIPELLRIGSNGYEFELDALLRCGRGKVIEEVPIRTIYIDDNASSHFDPILDSMRIYMVLLRFFFASLASALVDNAVFMLAFLLLPNVAVCQVLGRTASIGVNFTLNRSAVFRSREEVARTLPRYLALCLFSGLLSYALIRVFQGVGLPVLSAKLIAESLLFLMNFVALRKIVFAS